MSVSYFERDKANYFTKNVINFYNPNMEDFNEKFDLSKDKTGYYNNLVEISNQRFAESLIYNNKYSILNTSVLADTMVDIKTPKENTYPELGMLFIKSYLKQLIPGATNYLSPETFYKVFNKNQELVEIPYAVALYLGGLYYFQFTGSTINLKNQSADGLFERLNNITTGTDKHDIYNSLDLNRTPARSKGTYANDIKNGRIFYPSVQILNRSIYPGSKEATVAVAADTDLNGEEVMIARSFNMIDVMPPIGYGIQNRFLNEYNKYIFGDYLNGSYNTDTKNNGKPYNDGMPHAVIGGYCGISKPIQTYNSDVLEFTAFYRNVYVGGYDFPISDLVTEFKKNTNGIANPLNADILKSIMSSFVTYSKLKANYLSSKIDDAGLLDAVTKLCAIKQIQAQFIKDASEKYGYVVPDFYYLLAHFFFASFKPEKDKTNHSFLFEHRLDFDMKDENGVIPITMDNATYRLYQKSCLDFLLDYKLNITSYNIITGTLPVADRDTKIAEAITDFLKETWSLEKFNLLTEFSSVNGNVTFALYPSAGGFISPNGLFNGMNDGKHIISEQNYKDESRLAFSPGDDNFGSLATYFNVGLKPDEVFGVFDLAKNAQDNQDNAIDDDVAADNIKLETADTRRACYILNKNYDNDYFYRTTCFNNHAILKNTSRFLWFEGTDYGEQLKLDRNTKDPSYDFYEEFLSGTDSVVYNNDHGYNGNYFSSNYLAIENLDTFTKYKDSNYNEYFRFSNLLDSLDFEKLEEFKSLFLEFCNTETISDINENTFNVKTLMMSSTFMGSDDVDAFVDVMDPITEITMTADDIILALIGNSIYQYDFMAGCGLAKHMNVALTTAQGINFRNVTKTFCSTNITIANYSPMGSVAYGNNVPTLSPHLFAMSPDILFSDVSDYATLLAGYTVINSGVTENDVVRYLSRKILFADQYLAPYDPSQANAKTDEIKNLNEIYIKNRQYTKSQAGLVGVGLDDLYVTIVKKFFETLNIAYSAGLYKQLLKFIRTHILNILKQMGVVNVDVLPGNPIKTFDQYALRFLYVPGLKITTAPSVLLNTYPGVVGDNTTIPTPIINPQISGF